MNHEKTAIRTSGLSLLGNVFLAAAKWIAGYFGNSFALIADAIESTTDIFASLLTNLGLRYAAKPADSNHPYGHGRMETLITFMTVAFLVGSALVIAHEAWQNIHTPHQAPRLFTLWVLAGIIAWKELSYQWVLRKSKETQSSALKAEAWHHRSDAITSIAAFVGIAIACFMGKGYEVADDWAALFASAFIVYNAYLIFRPALGEAMDEHLHHALEEEIRKISHTVEGVMDTEKCFIRKAGMLYQLDLHVIVDGDLSVRQGHEIAHRLKNKLEEDLPRLKYILIHIEPFESSSTKD